MVESTSEQAAATEKRKATVESSYKPPLGIQLKVSGLLCGFKLSDILSASHHSADFCGTRADYITRRLRFLLLFFMFAVPGWIPVDYFTLSPEHFKDMALARGVLSTVLLMIWFGSMLRPKPLRSTLLLGLTVLAPSIFYLVAMWILNSGTPEVPLAGYSAMPFMIAALMGLFPVTLAFGLFTVVVVVLSFSAQEYWLGSLSSVPTLNMLWIIALICGITLWVQSGQLLMLLKLYRESTRDPLTGLINRRVLMNALELEIERGEPFTLLMFDLDRFKRINDQHGHLMGDHVLKSSAEIIEKEMRKTDLVARFGGEEFMVMLPGMTGEEALPVAERVRRTIEQARVETPEGVHMPLTTSVGVTQYITGEAIQQTMKRADDLLYQAKEQGRNRVLFEYPSETGETVNGDSTDADALADSPAA